MKYTAKTALKAALATAAACAPLCFANGAMASEPRTHDGLYLSLDTGLGYLSSSASEGPVSVKYSGVSIPFEVLVGGTVGPVAIGGGFLWDQVLSPSATLDTPAGSGTIPSPSDVTLHLFALHLFADFYPDPHGGFHVRPFVGYAGMTESCSGCTSNGPGGPIFGAGVGYDFWVANEWSIGVMGRFAYASLKTNDVTYSTIDPAILATFTFQ